MAAPMPLEQEETDKREAWKADALDKIVTLAGTGREFTSDDLYDAGMGKPPHPNMVGRVMRMGMDLGYIVRTQKVKPSRRRTRRHGWVAEYVGTHHMIQRNAA